MRVVLDSNCLVAAAMPWHVHHMATVAELSRRRAARDVFVIPAHSLFEAYSVMTRLPPPHRISPADALTILDRNWAREESIALTPSESWRALRQYAAAGVAGGRIHDGEIADCARKAKADEILTWNVRHFERLSSVRAVSPAGV